MKHFLLVAAIIVVMLSTVFSQERRLYKSFSVPTKSVPMDATLAGGEKDTLYPPSVTLSCVTGTADLQILTITQTQWIFGCNSYGDKEAAQVYDFGETYYEISGALAWIQKMGTAGTAYCKIYTVNPSTNQPHALIATSEPMLNSSMPINPMIIQQTYFNFAEPVKIKGKFAISVEYFCELSAGSAMGLASSANGCVVNDDKLSWILDSEGVWFSSQEYAAGEDVLKTDIYIAPIAEVLTSVQANDVNIDVSINPNPATESITITGIKGVREIKIADQMGKISFQTVVSEENTMDIDTDNFASGCYYIQFIYNDFRIETKKLLIEK